MSEPVWLTAELVITIHYKQLSEFGEPPGLRDAGMLGSALGPGRKTKWSNGEIEEEGLARWIRDNWPG
jgi:death on curing protein